jgi:hypothetical protein
MLLELSKNYQRSLKATHNSQKISKISKILKMQSKTTRKALAPQTEKNF